MDREDVLRMQTRPQTGTLRVTVKDPSGAVIPGAAVQLTRTDDDDAAGGASMLSEGQGMALATGARAWTLPAWELGVRWDLELRAWDFDVAVAMNPIDRQKIGQCKSR
jgi:hypothetical protein